MAVVFVCDVCFDEMDVFQTIKISTLMIAGEKQAPEVVKTIDVCSRDCARKAFKRLENMMVTNPDSRLKERSDGKRRND